MAIGAKKAIEELVGGTEREQWLNLPLIGCDGVPKTGQTWVRTGSLTATVIVPASSGQALALMTQALRTKEALPEPAVEVLTPK